MSTNHQALLAAIDALITKHGATNPELQKDLLQLKAELQQPSAIRDKVRLASLALRIATWVKFIQDCLEDGP